ncbi:adhesion G-protein coupled receptor G2-like isoform X1 [Triplophysa rosa]|uniref:adhesion G-protein coupled receptor G2-like isoform X1 n=1 Tax=Triplophysa rosa TaxID=992332 RepID=UPI002545F86D|nr:adhesion G-protein coupled receptor G2-like isoform X1 [Triplophysa rosa]XP_057200357.1 adhesion G-protein coupled receptor G2-like isoform X1 [Triplophysa rosa]XP_057200387.1 adhesion G-protein coupled receptor G2-like isoform X1 [Triplophysa rosa]
MSWQKHTFLWIIFCATCQIMCEQQKSKACPAIKLTCNTLNGNRCKMNGKNYPSTDGKCKTPSGKPIQLKITKGRGLSGLYKVITNEIIDPDVLFLSDQLQNLRSVDCTNLTGHSGQPVVTIIDTGSEYLLHVKGTQAVCVTCSSPSLTINSSTPSTSTATISASEASDLMSGFETIVDEMEKNNESTEEIVMEVVKGLVYRQDRNTEPKDVTMFSSSDQDEISVTQNIGQKQYSWLVKISAEAFNKSRLENNGSAFVGVLQFKNMDVNEEDQNHTVLNNEVYGISMGANISNLTDNIEIIIRAGNLVVENPSVWSCNSWDGRGNLKWTTFGCDTQIINMTIIKCSCSHLTFFAVLMSIPNADIPSSHVDSLTYISSIGCASSMFFLGIALFMHCLLRKNKSSQSTKILINMFVALFTLNLSFLSNESIADTQSSSVCTVIALIMHYSMLSTFTWFFLQALHVYFWLIRQNITIQNYMKKIIVSGWVCSCPVVVIIAALGEYKSVVIQSTAEKTTRMCWITNHYIHYIVNIGYYSLVFSFTTGVFVMIVTKMIQARNVRVADVKKAALKKRLLMILSLFVLLGLTWAVAFFSYGDMIIPSYYIFCVLNSFQGFFLFLYYYHIRNDVEGSFSDDPDRSSSSINTTQENI